MYRDMVHHISHMGIDADDEQFSSNLKANRHPLGACSLVCRKSLLR